MAVAREPELSRSELAAVVRALADAPTSSGPRDRSRGAYYTPPALAGFVARRVLAPLVATARWDGAVPRLRVLDPAAGDGRFLAAAHEVLLAAAVARGARPTPALAARIARRCLLGLERDPAVVAAVAARWPALPMIACEALTGAPPEAADVDAVVGNPPYVRSIRLRAADPELWASLRGRYAATGFGEWDLYAAFVEQSLAWLAPGGRAGLVVPSRWLTARTAGPLRAHLRATDGVRAVIDFGALQLFAGATTYASVVVLGRGGAAPTLARHTPAGWAVTAVAVDGAPTAPWHAAPARRVSARPGGPTLGEVAHIAKGAGTNADGVFVLPGAVLDGRWARATVGGVEVVVEAAATRACLRGRDVVAWGGVDEGAPHPRCVVPYDGDRRLAWAALRARWPRAAAHLAAHRARLEAREGGRFAGAEFIAFGRPQNLARHLGPTPRVVVPDVVAGARAMLAPGGVLIIDSAYAVYPRDGVDPAYADVALYLAILNAPVTAAWLAARSVPLRGGYTRMKTAALAPLPLPAPGPAAAIAAAARAGDRRAAETAVARAYRGALP
ncbi:MAG: N-6 DNA methylase [Kofleriaceae bacterium]